MLLRGGEGAEVMRDSEDKRNGLMDRVRGARVREDVRIREGMRVRVRVRDVERQQGTDTQARI